MATEAATAKDGQFVLVSILPGVLLVSCYASNDG